MASAASVVQSLIVAGLASAVPGEAAYMPRAFASGVYEQRDEQAAIVGRDGERQRVVARGNTSTSAAVPWYSTGPRRVGVGATAKFAACVARHSSLTATRAPARSSAASCLSSPDAERELNASETRACSVGSSGTAPKSYNGPADVADGGTDASPSAVRSCCVAVMVDSVAESAADPPAALESSPLSDPEVAMDTASPTTSRIAAAATAIPAFLTVWAFTRPRTSVRKSSRRSDQRSPPRATLPNRRCTPSTRGEYTQISNMGRGNGSPSILVGSSLKLRCGLYW